MEKTKNPNLYILSLALSQLGPLAKDMVFVGGCATGLLITDPAAPPIRVTRDVDAIVQVTTRAKYYQFSEKLRARGFTEDTSEGAPICRWKTDKVLLDVTPTDEKILGFSNEWYREAWNNFNLVSLPDGQALQLVSAPYFLMTKLDAFQGRGNNDFLGSHDMEDIIAVIDGRADIVEEIKLAEPKLVKELSKRLKKYLQDSKFTDAVWGSTPPGNVSRAPNIFKILESIAGL